MTTLAPPLSPPAPTPVAPPLPALPPSLEPGDLLLRAASIVRRGWCQHALAVDAAGMSATAQADGATRFCAIGAMERALWEAARIVPRGTGATRTARVQGLWRRMSTLAETASAPHGIAVFNDQHAHHAEDVAQMLERAAALPR
jgi:hypothetical protein